MSANGPVRPLRGITVVDFSHGIAGGYASKLLGDAGANVVKFEGLDGDDLRRRTFAVGTSPLFEHLHVGA